MLLYCKRYRKQAFIQKITRYLNNRANKKTQCVASPTRHQQYHGTGPPRMRAGSSTTLNSFVFTTPPTLTDSGHVELPAEKAGKM